MASERVDSPDQGPDMLEAVRVSQARPDVSIGGNALRPSRIYAVPTEMLKLCLFPLIVLVGLNGDYC